VILDQNLDLWWRWTCLLAIYISTIVSCVLVQTPQ
jgi:hypothetical protein